MEQKYQLQRSLTKLKEGTDYANGIQEGMVKIKEGLFSAIDKVAKKLIKKFKLTKNDSKIANHPPLRKAASLA